MFSYRLEMPYKTYFIPLMLSLFQMPVLLLLIDRQVSDSAEATNFSPTSEQSEVPGHQNTVYKKAVKLFNDAKRSC